METGKEASSLQAPHDYRKSMVSLSDKSLIPEPVHSRKPLDSNTVKIWDGGSGDQADAKIVNMNASQSTNLAFLEDCPRARHESRASRGSAYSSSVYSENSSATTECGARNRGRSFDSLIQSMSLEERKTRPTELTEKCSVPVEALASNASPELITPRPFQLSQSTSINLIGNSLAPQMEPFFLESSLSEPKPSSASSKDRRSGYNDVANEIQSETDSGFVSSGSSENITGPTGVRSYVIFHGISVNNLNCRSLLML